MERRKIVIDSREEIFISLNTLQRLSVVLLILHSRKENVMSMDDATVVPEGLEDMQKLKPLSSSTSIHMME